MIFIIYLTFIDTINILNLSILKFDKNFDDEIKID